MNNVHLKRFWNVNIIFLYRMHTELKNKTNTFQKQRRYNCQAIDMQNKGFEPRARVSWPRLLQLPSCCMTKILLKRRVSLKLLNPTFCYQNGKHTHLVEPLHCEIKHILLKMCMSFSYVSNIDLSFDYYPLATTFGCTYVSEQMTFLCRRDTGYSNCYYPVTFILHTHVLNDEEELL